MNPLNVANFCSFLFWSVFSSHLNFLSSHKTATLLSLIKFFSVITNIWTTLESPRSLTKFYLVLKFYLFSSSLINRRSRLIASNCQDQLKCPSIELTNTATAVWYFVYCLLHINKVGIYGECSYLLSFLTKDFNEWWQNKKNCFHFSLNIFCSRKSFAKVLWLIIANTGLSTSWQLFQSFQH